MTRDIATVLAERAAALAVPVHNDTEAETLELVVLRVGQERYGVDATRVVEVHEVTGLAPIPGLPPWWAGVANVRGTLWPVLDLRTFLDLPPSTDPAAPTEVAFVRSTATVGLLVDDALDLRTVPADQLGPAPAGSPAAARGQVRGTTPELLTLLDVDRLLADPRLAVQEEPE